MVEYIILLGIAVLVIAFIGYKYYVKQRTLRYIRSQYGTTAICSFDDRSFHEIAQYHSVMPPDEQNAMDNQTWIDLQMDRFFEHVNHTQSVIGREYLYHHLHVQQHDNLDTFEKKVQYFETHPKQRLDLQYSFYKIQSTSENKMIEYIADPKKFPKTQTYQLVAQAILAVGTILMFIFYPEMAIDQGLGVIGAVFVITWAMMLYAETIKRIDAAWGAVLMLFAAVKSIKVIRKLDPTVFAEEVGTMQTLMKKEGKKIQQLSSFSDLFVGGASGMLLFVSIYFGLYGFIYNYAVTIFKKYGDALLDIYQTIGYLEVCMATASYRTSLDGEYCTPKFTEDKKVVFSDIYHPLLKDPVTNSKALDPLFIITGANASGKTTFAKTIALNAVVSQTLNMSFAEMFSMHPANVYSSINIGDDLLQGDSFYMAEIKRLRSMIDAAENGVYAMFFMDEMLKGTNATERIAAAATILEHFAKSGNFLCITTHDIELSEMLEKYYTNYHFREEEGTDELHYDYKIYDGITTGSNAIALLRVCKYPEEIVDKANKIADNFKTKGTWETLS